MIFKAFFKTVLNRKSLLFLFIPHTVHWTIYRLIKKKYCPLHLCCQPVPNELAHGALINCLQIAQSVMQIYNQQICMYVLSIYLNSNTRCTFYESWLSSVGIFLLNSSLDSVSSVNQGGTKEDPARGSAVRGVQGRRTRRGGTTVREGGRGRTKVDLARDTL